MSGNRVISKDAGRFKRFYFVFFLSTNTPFLPHANRVSLAALFHLCHPNQLGPFPLHRFGVAHQTSLRSRSTMMSYAISPQGGGSPKPWRRIGASGVTRRGAGCTRNRIAV
jgi:hypothetical protein